VGTGVVKNQNSDFECVIVLVPDGFVHPLICPISLCYVGSNHQKAGFFFPIQSLKWEVVLRHFQTQAPNPALGSICLIPSSASRPALTHLLVTHLLVTAHCALLHQLTARGTNCGLQSE